jgi:hypothetical protein
VQVVGHNKRHDHKTDNENERVWGFYD